jgi:hypothetical protein
MVERRINAELRLDNRRRVLVAGAAGLAKSAKEAMFLDPLGRRPRIPGASIGRRPVKTDRGQVDLYEDQSGLLCNFAGNRYTHLGSSTLTPLPVGGESIVPLGVDRFGQSGGIAISTAPTVSMPR